MNNLHGIILAFHSDRNLGELTKPRNTCSVSFGGSYRLVLQPQNKPHLLRAWLSRHGWHIRQERLVRDGRFLYTVMECVYEEVPPLSPGQCWLSPALLACGQEELDEYIERTLRILQNTALGDPSVQSALDEWKGASQWQL